MEIFKSYLEKIDNQTQREKIKEVLNWVMIEFPELMPKIAWHQPMFTHHETFIIGFNVSKHHLAIAPEHVSILHFSNDIINAGFEHSQQLVKFKWSQTFNYELLNSIIKYNIKEKAGFKTFWRK